MPSFPINLFNLEHEMKRKLTLKQKWVKNETRGKYRAKNKHKEMQKTSEFEPYMS